MFIRAFAVASACSLIAGAALAGDDKTTSNPGTDVTAQSTAPAPSSDTSVPASAVTPSANVASSTTSVDPATGATLTRELIASAPVPDTPANRARYGAPMSHAGKMTAPRGN